MSDAVVNPLLDYRLSLEPVLSVKQLAQKMKVTESTVVRTEQGLYNEIPPTILWYLATFYLSSDSVSSQYARFKSDKRRRVYESGRLDPYYRSVLAAKVIRWPTWNPFIIWREEMGYKSRLAFCKDLCLHPSTIKRLEDGLAETLPITLKSALNEVFVDWEYLDEQYREYRDRTKTLSAKSINR